MIPQNIVDTMISRRRDFHHYPEAGWEEFRTTAKVAEVLLALKYDVHFGGEFYREQDIMGRNVDVAAEEKRAIEQGADPQILAKMGGYTGLYADWDTGTAGPFTVLRFDIDCVETSESDGAAHVPAKLGFRSVNKGRAHACGHDGHMAIGLGVAELLRAPDSPVKKGKIRLLFQPAEEGVRGGYAMTQAGLADKADYFIAFHLGLGNPTGEIYGGVHSFLCSTKIDAEYTGTAAHAGMEPHKGKNALLAACTAALNLHAIAPHKDGVMRLNVGVLQAGEGRNVVPPKGVMKIETRGETEAIAQYVYKRAVEVLEGAAAMYDITLKVTKQGETNTAASDEALAKIAAEAASKVPGMTSAKVLRGMDGSDDACWYMKRVQEGGGQATYIALGATIAAGHHNGAFDFDEAALAIGAETIVGTVAKLYE